MEYPYDIPSLISVFVMDRELFKIDVKKNIEWEETKEETKLGLDRSFTTK